MNITTPQQLWIIALRSLQIQVSPTHYERWLKNSVGLTYDSGLFVVGVPHASVAEWLRERLSSLIRRTLITITGYDLDVEFRVVAASHVSTGMAPDEGS